MKLFYSESIEDFKRLVKLNKGNTTNCLLLTMNYELVKYAEKVCQIEIEELDLARHGEIPIVDNVISEVMNILTVNLNAESIYLCQCMYHSNSGLQGEIAYTVVLLQKIHIIFEKYRIDEIFLCINHKYQLNTNIIMQYAKKNYIKIKTSHLLKNELFTYKGNLKENVILSKIFLVSKMYYVLKNLKNFLLFFRKAISSKGKIRHDEYSVGLLFCDHSIKNFNWVLPIAKSFDANMKTNIICMGAEEKEREWKKFGFKSENIENYITFTGLYKALIKNKNIKKKINLKPEYFNNISLKIGKEENHWARLFYPYVKQYVESQILRNCFLDECVKEHLKSNKYLAISGWGNSNNIYTRLFYFNTIRIVAPPTYFFVELIGVWGVYENEPDFEMFDYYFVNCKKNIDNLQTRYPKTKFFHINLPLYIKADIGSLKSEVTNERIKILWAPSGTVSSSFHKSNNEMLKYLIQKNCDIYVKFHPNVKEVVIEEYKSLYKDSNCIIFCEPKGAFAEIVQMCDILITTVSFSIFDGIIAQKPVISFVLNDWYKYVQEFYGIERHKNIEDVITMLNEVLNDSQSFIRWRNQRIDAQNCFILNEFFPNEEEGPHSVVRIIEKVIGDLVI